MFKNVKSLYSRQNSFFPVVVMHWNKVDVKTWNSAACNVFNKAILKFIRP